MLTDKQIEELTGKAEDAFWSIIIGNLPEIDSGDIDPITAINFHEICVKTVKHWIALNN